MRNREQSYLHAVFAELKRLGEWSGENPLTGIRKFREEEKELAFLYVDEIERLLIACDESRNKDLGVVVRIGLATGARWSEAEGLKQSQVLPGRITFVKTKGKKNRTVPISPQLQANHSPRRFSSAKTACRYDCSRLTVASLSFFFPFGFHSPDNRRSL